MTLEIPGLSRWHGCGHKHKLLLAETHFPSMPQGLPYLAARHLAFAFMTVGQVRPCSDPLKLAPGRVSLGFLKMDQVGPNPNPLQGL
jgi:hypothetical protein